MCINNVLLTLNNIFLGREVARVQIYPKGENWVTLGTQYELHCYVEGGFPLPVITWDRNGGRSLSSHVQILQNNKLR